MYSIWMFANAGQLRQDPLQHSDRYAIALLANATWHPVGTHQKGRRGRCFRQTASRKITSLLIKPVLMSGLFIHFDG
jgi:hypothetical protein